MNLGDKVIECSQEFRLYLTTTMSNPHYLPDLSTKVTLINFMITAVGLEEQLLSILLMKERLAVISIAPSLALFCQLLLHMFHDKFSA